MPPKRLLVLLAVVSLPAVAIVAWWGIVRLDVLRMPAPRWSVPAKDQICYGDVITVGARPGDPPPEVSETPAGILSPDRAALIAYHVMARQVGSPDLVYVLMYSEGPTLVQATFPDGVRRLAWRFVSLITQDESGMSGVAAAVYLDAGTGEPLALVRGISVCEPSWSPLLRIEPNQYFWQIWLQTEGLPLLLAFYVVVVLLISGVVAGLRWLRLRYRLHRRPA